MSEEIIIDGVNVAGCMYFDNVMCQAEKRADGNTITECFGFTCYYKRLKRLQAENERLKDDKNRYELYIKQERDNNYKYKQALEEIREICKKETSHYDSLIAIVTKVGEVLDERYRRKVL